MYLGIDIGGTKTLLATLTDEGTIHEQYKFPTPPDYYTFIATLQEALTHLSTQQLQAAAVGVPGFINRSLGTVHVLANLPWRDAPIFQDVSKLVDCPVAIENDSRTAALAEAQLLKATHRNIFYLTISTGIGGGFVVNGKLDPNLLDTEVGQIIFPHDGDLVRWESFASGKALVQHYGILASELTDPDAWETIAGDIGLGVIACIALTQPDAVVFGGGVGGHFEKFAHPLTQFIKQHLHPLVKTPQLLKARHAEQAVIYGCYELAKDLHASTAA